MNGMLVAQIKEGYKDMKSKSRQKLLFHLTISLIYAEKQSTPQ